MGTSALATQRRSHLARLALGLALGLALSTQLGCPRNASEHPPPATVPTATVPTATVPPATAAPSTPPPVTTTTASPADASRWHGSWASDGCGERSYRRVINLAAGGEVTGQDRVSPCPPGARCIWSGIVRWSGSWSSSGERIALELATAAGAHSGGINLPRELAWDAATKAPVEMHGDVRCPYQALSSAN